MLPTSLGQGTLSDNVGSAPVVIAQNNTSVSLCEGKTYKLTLAAPRFITWNNKIINVTASGGVTGGGGATNIAETVITFSVSGSVAGIAKIFVHTAATVTPSSGNIEYHLNFNNAASPTASFGLSGVVGVLPGFICNGSDIVLDANCTNNCGAPANVAVPRFQWEAERISNGATLSGTPTRQSFNYDRFTIADADLIAGESYRITMTTTNGNTDKLGAGCTDTYVRTFESRRTPVLGTMDLNGSGGNTLSMCFNGTTEDAEIACSNCNDYIAGGGLLKYTWAYRITSGPTPAVSATPFAPGGIASNVSSASHTFSAIDPDALLSTGPNIYELFPGTYALSATVEMNGCRDTASGTLTVNDIPAVNASWRAADAGNLFGSIDGATRLNHFANGDQVCAGTDLQLISTQCASQRTSNGNADGYDFRWTSQSVPNLSGNAQHPSTNTKATRPNQSLGEYDCACSVNCSNGAVGNGVEFPSYTWTVSSSSGSFSGTLTNNTSRVANTKISIAPGNASETITYTLNVTDENGCKNYDEIKVLATNAPIAFNNPANIAATTGSIATPASIDVCVSKGTLNISGHCNATALDDCLDDGASPGFPIYTWSKLNGSLGFTGVTTSASMETSALANNVGITRYQLKIEDQWGCTGYALANVNVIELAPDFSTTNLNVCPNTGIYFVNSNHVTGQYYDIHTATPITSVNRIAFDKNHGDALPGGGDGIYLDISMLSPGVYTYYIRTKDATGTNPDCEAETPITFTVRDLPILTASVPTSTPYELCMPTNFWFTNSGDFRIDATGGTGPYSYTWTPTGFDGYTFAWGSIRNRYYIKLNQSNSLPITNASLSVDVSDSYCTVNHIWNNIKIEECGEPSLIKRKMQPGGSFAACDKYICSGEGINLRVDWAGNAPNDVTYNWSTGSSVHFTNYGIGSVTADSTFTSVTITTQGKNYVFNDTTVISRPPINMYPNADTATCLNETFLASARCPTCYGTITYTWDGNTSGTYTGDGSAWDSYVITPTGGAGATHVLTLSIDHGEGCNSVITKNVDINDLPNPSLRRQGGAAISGPIYLCDGETEVLYVDPTSCSTCGAYSWNTTANNDSIIVSSQGGYYAQVVDGNSCLGASNVAIVIDAHTGLNSPISATPSQICSNQPVDLEVTPCVGCSYVWHNALSGSLPAQTAPDYIYSVTTPGNYYVAVTNPEGCTYNTAQINVSATTLTIPSITGTTDSICQGASTTLSTPFIVGASYQWYESGNIISAAIDTSHEAYTAGDYTVVVTYPNGCLEESPIFNVYQVNFKPNIIAIDTVVCSTTTADLYTSLHPGWQYQWYDDGVAVVGANGSIYSASSAGSHYVEVRTNYGCVIRSDSVRISTSSLSIPIATTSTPFICPNELGTVSVSLCQECSYQWFNATTGLAITTKADTNYRYNRITTTGNYYAIVSDKMGCFESSDTVTITVNSVFTPAINTSSSVVCDGRDALLVTPSCAGCTYNWLLDTVPVLGALNDTFHLVNSISDIGSYQIAVDYPNGCTDTSAALVISNGSYTVALELDSSGTVPPDYVICNGVGETLIATPSQLNIPGTYLYTLFLNNTPVTLYTNVTSNSFFVDNQGVYTVEVTNPDQCRELSNLISLTEVNVLPVLSARATSDPSSVQASAICTDSGRVYLEVSGCSNCTYEWTLGGTTVDSIYSIWLEDFESVALGTLPPLWSRYQAAGSTGWVIDNTTNQNSTNFVIPATNTTVVAASNDDSCICDMSEDYLVTPEIDLRNLGRYVFMEFDVYAPGNIGSVARIKVSTTGSTGPWTTISTITPDADWQTEVRVDLSAYLDTSIWINFHHDDQNGTGDGFALDNVELFGSTQQTTFSNVYLTYPGSLGKGIYIVNATKNGCEAATTPKTIADLIGTINSNANTTDTSICNGQSVTLEHAASNGNPITNCSGCSFRWLRNTNPINGASSFQFITSTPGRYNLEVTTSNGCIDTSGQINIRKVDPPTGLTLNFDTLVNGVVNGNASLIAGTPLAANGDTIDLNNWIFPESVRHDSLGSGAFSYFSSTPFNASLNCNGVIPCNPGLNGIDSVYFIPNDTIAGYHLITYHYDTLGCSFTVEDILEVLPPGDIVVTNTNLSSVPYEACIGDSLVINTINLDYPIDEVYAFDVNDNYIQLPLGSVVNTADTFGFTVRWNTTIGVTIPGFANASYLMLVNSATHDTTFTSFVLIHNTDLSFTGLPSTLCSNGTGATLFGNPTGGSFSATRAGNPNATIPGVFVGDTLYPTSFNAAAYSDGSQWVDIYYSYTEAYTNGNLCPTNDTVSIRREVKDVRLTDVQFNTISVSQTKELLTNLVYQVTPYEARPNKQPLYTSSFSGSFTNPAGNPTEFLPANAGVGKHALTYSIKSGICINSIEDSITVVSAPTPIAIPDTICRNNGTVNFGRDVAFSYNSPSVIFPTGGVTYMDTFHIMSVTGLGVSTGNTNPGAETFTYNPAGVTGNYDTLVIQYRYHRGEDTLGVNFDTLEYIVGQIIKPIYIEDLSSVAITDTIVSSFYCQEDVLHLLAASPSNNSLGGGLFMLYGGNNQYQFGDTLLNNVINPYDVNHLENATTTYDLVYILNGVACNNSDTLQVTISKGLNPSFATVGGLKEFCDTDPDVAIIHNVTSPDTAIWKIGGIPQSSYVFPPNPLDPGIHVVELQMVDTFGCTASVLDTFTIHALPSLTMTPSLNSQYCANDAVVDFVVSPSPGCPIYSSPGHYILNEDFDGGIPTWNTTNVNSGKPWVQTTTLAQGGVGKTAFIDTSNVLDDSWLISPSLSLVAGHTYRLSFMVQAGALDSTCSTGVCDAAMVVALGSSSNPAAITNQLWFSDSIKNDLTYVRHTVTHYHDPSIGYTTGQHHLGFRSVTPALGRSLRLDNVILRDITIGSCSQDGIGYVDGTGIHNRQDSAYQFNPLAATPGTSNIEYVYTDVRGCQNSLVYTVTVDTAPVVSFTNLAPSYCENLPTVLLTGTPSGGNFSSTMTTNLIDIPFFAPLNAAFNPVNYQMNTTGTDIVSYVYTDANGCSETYHDTVTVVALLDSNVISNALDPFGIGYCDYDTTRTLDVQAILGTLITNGTFYGPGVRNGSAGVGVATFHPDSAVLDMGHVGDANLSYIYTTTTGCIDTARFVTRIHQTPNLAFMNLSDSLCLNQDSFIVRVQNSVDTGATGQMTFTSVLGIGAGDFSFSDVNGNVLSPDPMPLFDRLRPWLLTGHEKVHVSYYYRSDPSFGSCESTIYDSIRVDSIPNVYFKGLKPYYCEDEQPSILFGFPPYYVGSGYLLIDSTQIDSGFYWIDPAQLVGPGQTIGVHSTYYTYQDRHGCSNYVSDTFEVRPYPRITFAPNYQDTFCRQVGTYDLNQIIASPVGGFFTDNLALTSIRDSSFLDLNSLAGPRLVTYHYLDSATQCYNEESFWIYLFNGAGADFTVYGGCAQMDVTFSASANNLVAGIDSITSISWDFEGNGTITTSHLDTSNITLPDTTYQYSTSGTYDVTLYIQNQGSCVDTIIKPLIISPYYDLATDYFEDFNTNAGDWYDDQVQSVNVSNNNIWTRENSLNGTRIVSGNGAWVTTADSLYRKDQQAWVYSPCFDFTNSRRPMIAFDLWRDVLDGIDGVVMEHYNNTTNQWELLGDVGQGISWYQSDFVLARPGNQPIMSTAKPRGWTGRSGRYESVRLRLDQFKNQRDIRFRIAFASSPQTVIDTIPGNGYEGAAFDNVWIGERRRNVLVEHFNNEYYTTPTAQTSDVVDQSVYDKIFTTTNGLDVILIQYQVDDHPIVGDQVFDRNTADLGSRKLYYSSVPNNIFIDGRSVGSGKSDSLNTWDLDYDMLQFPDFRIDIDTVITMINSDVTINATIEALVAKDSADYILHAVVIQDSLTYNTRGFNMLSIARKMLPDHRGTRENHSWFAGQTVTLSKTWTDYSGELGRSSFNPSQLEGVVFIQNHTTKEVYQVATSQDLNRYTGTKKIEEEVAAEIFNLNVYPNPSSDLFNVEFEKALEGEYDWRLVDVTGRVLQQGTATSGTRKFAINADRLVNGAYFFVINSDDNTTYAQRKLIVIK